MTRSEEDIQIWAAFRHHSRTFSLAARFLPKAVRMPVATLYQFCRMIDTIADERVRVVGPTAALGEVEAAHEALDATLAGWAPDGRLWRRLGEVHAQFHLNPVPLYELVDGARWDLEGRTVDTLDDLIHYSNLVGGSVGAMMLPFLLEDRTRAPALDGAARSLGIAMQITNILRDVGEDRRDLGRSYLPTTWLAEHGIDPVALTGPALPTSYPDLVEALMAVAEQYYEEGMAGIGEIPPKMRLGIRGAARMYREILNEVRRRHYDNLTTRAYVTLWRKLSLVALDGYEGRRRQAQARAVPA